MNNFEMLNNNQIVKNIEKIPSKAPGFIKEIFEALRNEDNVALTKYNVRNPEYNDKNELIKAESVNFQVAFIPVKHFNVGDFYGNE